MTATIIDPEAAAAEVARAREILEKPMSEPMGVGELREKVARIIRDPGLGYNIELVRMVDGIATYLADVDGDGPREFPSYAEALTHVQDFSALHKADAILSLLPTGVDGGGSARANPSPLAAAQHSSDETLAPSAARRPWLLLGYAPGDYLCRCVVCGEGFTGDKRAVNCIDCAAARANELLSSAPPNPVTDPLRATTESGAWRPIESAPKAATDSEPPICLLLAWFNSTESGGRSYQVGEGYWRPEDDGGGAWWWANTTPGDYYTSPIIESITGQITHWMPLPSPPSLGASA